jgi:hypothetical protein
MRISFNTEYWIFLNVHFLENCRETYTLTPVYRLFVYYGLIMGLFQVAVGGWFIYDTVTAWSVGPSLTDILILKREPLGSKQ